MAEVRLADVIVPLERWTAGTIRESLRINALFNSGLVANDPLLTQYASENQSQVLDIPYLGDLADDEPNVSSDDPAVLSVPKKITSEREKALKSMKNQSWSTMDLASALGASPDPAVAISNRVAAYWSRQYDHHVINMVEGIVANNIANDGGDMVHDITALAAPANVISGAAVIDAKGTLGDRGSQITTMVGHSTVVDNLRKQNLITTISAVGPSGSNVTFDTYLGYRIVESDSCRVAAGVYDTYFGAGGVLRYGNGAPRTPTEVERKADAGNGEGQEILHSRNHFVFHPLGHRWEGAAVAGLSPTWAELQDATNWTRVAERKRVPLAVLRSAG